MNIWAQLHYPKFSAGPKTVGGSKHHATIERLFPLPLELHFEVSLLRPSTEDPGLTSFRPALGDLRDDAGGVARDGLGEVAIGCVVGVEAEVDVRVLCGEDGGEVDLRGAQSVRHRTGSGIAHPQPRVRLQLTCTRT